MTWCWNQHVSISLPWCLHSVLTNQRIHQNVTLAFMYFLSVDDKKKHVHETSSLASLMCWPMCKSYFAKWILSHCVIWSLSHVVMKLEHLSFSSPKKMSVGGDLPPLGRDSLKSPSVASQVLPSPPHTRHRSSLASELRMLSQPTCFKAKVGEEMWAFFWIQEQLITAVLRSDFRFHGPRGC